MVVWVNCGGEVTEFFFVLPTQRLSRNNQEAMHKGKRVFWNSSLPLMPCPRLLVGIVSGRLPLVGLAFLFSLANKHSKSKYIASICWLNLTKKKEVSLLVGFVHYAHDKCGHDSIHSISNP
jgi:hypothetical protein